MSIIGLFVLFLIAAICGSIAQAIAGYTFGGCVTSVAVGFIGAMIGSWMASHFGMPMILGINIEGQVFPVVWAIIGSVVFVIAVGLITRRSI